MSTETSTLYYRVKRVWGQHTVRQGAAELIGEGLSRGEAEDIIRGWDFGDYRTYYTDELIRQLREEDQEWDASFYQGEGWYGSCDDLLWSPGEDHCSVTDDYDLYIDAEVAGGLPRPSCSSPITH